MPITDLTENQAAAAVKVIGSDATGLEGTALVVETDGAARAKLNNGVGIDAVNIQDGGNSITVDGAVAVSNFPSTQNVAVISIVEVEIKNDAGNPLPVSAASLPLPAGASTSANQATSNALLTAIDAGIPNALGSAIVSASMPVNIASDQVVPVSAASLPLPTGAATAAKQDTGNTSLASIDTKTPTLGQKNMAGSTPVVFASDQSAIPVTSTPSSDRLGSAVLAALNAIHAVNTQGCNTAMFNLTGTWVGTLSLEATVDGANWFDITGFDEQTDLRITTTTANRVFGVNCGGFSQVRIRFSLFTSGSASISSDAALGLNDPYNNSTIRNNNTAIPPQSQLLSGTDGTNLIPIAVDSLGRLVTSSLTGFGADFAFGDITTAALTRILVRRTTYTEQTVNAQRSVASSSASDAPAAIGSRTIKITYLDQNGAGPFTEIVTLNGITGVNTVATNMCFIEQIEVITSGSTGSNVGIITLYAAVAKGGVVIGTIAATDNQTFWAHHYVPINKTCNITGISCGHNGTTVGSGALFTINSKSLSNVNAVEIQASDFVRLYGQTSTFARNYTSPIKLAGPTRLQVYVTPETASSTVYRAAFDFFEP